MVPPMQLTLAEVLSTQFALPLSAVAVAVNATGPKGEGSMPSEAELLSWPRLLAEKTKKKYTKPFNCYSSSNNIVLGVNGV